MIPAIESQKAMDARPLAMMFDLDIPSALGHELLRRLQAGEYKYRDVWTKADLRTDLIEELMDGLNYVVLMALRVKGANKDSPVFTAALTSLAGVLQEALDTADMLPAFDGPTSKEWALTWGTAEEAQAAFQEGLSD